MRHYAPQGTYTPFLLSPKHIDNYTQLAKLRNSESDNERPNTRQKGKEKWSKSLEELWKRGPDDADWALKRGRKHQSSGEKLEEQLILIV